MSESGPLHRRSRGVPWRRRAHLVRTVLVAAWCSAAVAPALADTVLLHNGDRLTGRILHLSPDALTLETTWAGEMRILRYEVRAIETDKPMIILRERADGLEWATLKPGDPGREMLVPARPEEMEGPLLTDGVEDVAVQPSGPPTPLDVALPSIRYINPKPEESGEGVSYDGRITLSGALTRGNSTTERLYVESDNEARALDWRSLISLKLRRERDHGSLVAANWLVSGNFDRFLGGTRNFRYVRASAENDRFRDLDLRTALGVGLGVQLLDTERTKWSARAGFDVIDARYRLARDDNWPALGWGVNLTHRVGLLSAELFHDQTGFWNLEDASQVSLRSRSGIRLPFVSGLTASLQLNLDWESEPASGQRAVDTSWLVGLGYAW